MLASTPMPTPLAKECRPTVALFVHVLNAIMLPGAANPAILPLWCVLLKSEGPSDILSQEKKHRLTNYDRRTYVPLCQPLTRAIASVVESRLNDGRPTADIRHPPPHLLASYLLTCVPLSTTDKKSFHSLRLGTRPI